MSASELLDKKINGYLARLNTKQKMALLSVAETFIEEQEEVSQWNDAEFIKEIDKRFAEYESGKIKGITLDALEIKARKLYKAKKANVK